MRSSAEEFNLNVCLRYLSPTRGGTFSSGGWRLGGRGRHFSCFRGSLRGACSAHMADNTTVITSSCEGVVSTRRSSSPVSSITSASSTSPLGTLGILLGWRWGSSQLGLCQAQLQLL